MKFNAWNLDTDKFILNPLVRLIISVFENKFLVYLSLMLSTEITTCDTTSVNEDRMNNG